MIGRPVVLRGRKWSTEAYYRKQWWVNTNRDYSSNDSLNEFYNSNHCLGDKYLWEEDTCLKWTSELNVRKLFVW